MSDEINTYTKPDMGEDNSEKEMPIGWIADYVDVPEGWEVEFIESGKALRFRNRVDREKYGLKPPGFPGVGITSGWDYWAIIADTDHVIHPEGDVWHDPEDDPEEIIQSVEEAIEAVQNDLERVRLSKVIGDAVPSSVIDTLINRFGCFERVVEIEDDTTLLESVDGIGPKRREEIQQKFMKYKMSQTDD